MTTNMEQTVIEILNGVNNNVQQAVQFAMENMPEFVNQIFAWGIISNLFQKDLKVENKKTNI